MTLSADKPFERAAARLAAVQALYQIEHSGGGAAAVVREYREHRLGENSEFGPFEHTDEALFEQIVLGVVADQARIDKAISKRLAKNWRLDRIDSILRAALRAGAFEILDKPDLPAAVIIDEYVGVVASFLTETDSGFANGLLDRMAKEVRKPLAGTKA